MSSVEEGLGERSAAAGKGTIADTSYDDGSVYIGRHSDTAENRVIAAVSLGSARTLVFTPRAPPRHVLSSLSSAEVRALEGRHSVKLRYARPGYFRCVGS